MVRLRDENDHGLSAVPSFDRLRTNGIGGLGICEMDSPIISELTNFLAKLLVLNSTHSSSLNKQNK